MGKREASKSEMVALLRRWERSGLSLTRFADQERVSRRRLYRWRRRTGIGSELIRRGRRRPRSSATTTAVASGEPSVMFREVEPSELCTAASARSSAACYEVVLADGTTLRIPERFSAESVRSLVQTLRAC